MNKPGKADIIEQIRSRAADASIAVVSDFKGMTVEELTRLRIKVREAGAELYVVKNTLARIAFTETGHSSIKDDFKENCILALGFDEPVALAKALVDFQAASKLFKVRHASFDGEKLSASQVEELSKLPSKDVLRAQLLGLFGAAPTGFVSVLANSMRQVLNVLKVYEEKKAA